MKTKWSLLEDTKTLPIVIGFNIFLLNAVHAISFCIENRQQLNVEEWWTEQFQYNYKVFAFLYLSLHTIAFLAVGKKYYFNNKSKIFCIIIGITIMTCMVVDTDENQQYKYRQISQLQEINYRKHKQIKYLIKHHEKKLKEFNESKTKAVKQMEELNSAHEQMKRQMEQLNSIYQQKERQMEQLNSIYQQKERKMEELNSTYQQKERKMKLENQITNKQKQIQIKMNKTLTQFKVLQDKMEEFNTGKGRQKQENLTTSKTD